MVNKLGLQKHIFDTKDEKTAMQLIDSSSYAKQTKGWLKWQWRKRYLETSLPNVQFIDYLKERKKSIENELAKINLLLKSSSHVQTEQDGDPCMICKHDSDGYDLKCGHPICYSCFRKHNCKITCTVCGFFDSYDSYDT